jgi:hypothetical protein
LFEKSPNKNKQTNEHSQTTNDPPKPSANATNAADDATIAVLPTASTILAESPACVAPPLVNAITSLIRDGTPATTVVLRISSHDAQPCLADVNDANPTVNAPVSSDGFSG